MPFCETCRALSNALSEASSRLDVAALHTHEVSGVGKPELFNAAMLEAQSIRRECETLKAEFDRHQAEDHPTKAGEAFGASGT
jgi:hypothetical protein